ncbi:hypothetical protein [Nocardiopsis sp. CC223A]|uniref:hypothetical protein n=1 Tax=Nocardiopsis sp. CC223A TaxID=3044051 RepID=UPI00278C131C|nr:hypothetical protein [Nocardiopsis sp. CC223A]
MLRGLVSARIDSVDPSDISWVFVQILKDDSLRISQVSVPKSLVDGCFGESDISREEIGVVSEISEVDSLISSLGVNPDSLEEPWKNEFPL